MLANYTITKNNTKIEYEQFLILNNYFRVKNTLNNSDILNDLK